VVVPSLRDSIRFTAYPGLTSWANVFPPLWGFRLQLPLDGVRPVKKSWAMYFRRLGCGFADNSTVFARLSSSPLLALIYWNTTLGNIHSVQAAPNQIDVVQAGDDGE